MKLAEALSIRADLQKKVAQLKERIKESAKVQEGDSTHRAQVYRASECDKSHGNRHLALPFCWLSFLLFFFRYFL